MKRPFPKPANPRKGYLRLSRKAARRGDRRGALKFYIKAIYGSKVLFADLRPASNHSAGRAIDIDGFYWHREPPIRITEIVSHHS